MDWVIVNRKFPCCGQTVRVPTEAVQDTLSRTCKHCGRKWTVAMVPLPANPRATARIIELQWTERK